MRNYFDVLGVERKFHLSEGELEQKFLELSRKLHPDRFARAPASERVAALQKSTELNDAYKVLKDRVKRGEYLLKLEGLDIADEKLQSVKADPALLHDMMERNEALAEAKLGGDQAKVDALKTEIEADRARTLSELDRGFAAYEGGDKSVLGKVAQSLVALRYHARFLAQANGEELL